MNAPLSHKMMLQTLPSGKQHVYHIGSLMFDRTQEGPYSRMVDEVATAAYEAYQRGEVTLVQRKIGPLRFEYIAIRH